MTLNTEITQLCQRWHYVTHSQNEITEWELKPVSVNKSEKVWRKKKEQLLNIAIFPLCTNFITCSR